MSPPAPPRTAIYIKPLSSHMVRAQQHTDTDMQRNCCSDARLDRGRLHDGGAHGRRDRGAEPRRQAGKLAPQRLLHPRRQLRRQAL